MKPKIAVLGMGSIGMRHINNLMEQDVPVRGWDPEKPNKMSREEVIAGADGVIICTPTRQHMNDMLDCHGKHILVEKPMAFDAPEPMLRGFYQGKTSRSEIVAVGNNLRFHHCVKEVKKMVDGGLIGKIGWADFKVLQKTEKELYLMDGVSRNWGAHEIDLALYLLGPGNAVGVKDVDIRDGNDVAMEIALAHESGAYSTVRMDYLTEPEERGFKLVGAKGIIEADLVARTVKVSNLIINSVNQMTDTWDQNYKDELNEFLKCMQLRSIPKVSPLASGGEGAAVQDVILSARMMAGIVEKEPPTK